MRKEDFLAILGKNNKSLFPGRFLLQTQLGKLKSKFVPEQKSLLAYEFQQAPQRMAFLC